MAGEIVVGYDGSSNARAALREAAAVANAFGTTVVVAFGYEVWAAGGETADHKAIIQQMGEAAAAEALQLLAAEGVEAETEVVADRPAEALMRVAEARGARMIVVGTHGEGPLRGAILGSVPYRLLPNSSVPVLVVPER
jgi:nucleotide-binding universal stress UspA family protein